MPVIFGLIVGFLLGAALLSFNTPIWIVVFIGVIIIIIGTTGWPFI